MGISNGYPGASHHRHPVSNDLYAVVSKPPSSREAVVSKPPILQSHGSLFRNGVSGLGAAPAMSGSPVPSYSSVTDTSPVTYIMDNNGPASHTGTHV